MTGANLVTLYAALGLEAGRAQEGGRNLGTSRRAGSQVHYYDAAGRRLGYAEVVGGEIMLRDPGGKTVQRFRIQRAR